MTVRKVYFAVTVVLAAALCAVIWISVRERSAAEEILRAKTQENALLRKRAETAEANSKLVVERFAEVMKAFANEAGHLSGRSLRHNEKSFVQIYSFYRMDRKNMATAGTACYLGGPYFLTAKHVVVPEAPPGKQAPKAVRVQVRVGNELIAAHLVDNGETQEFDQIDVGDWAIVKADEAVEGLVPVKPNPSYVFNFGERLVRYGNDSNRGIAPAAGYVAQVSENGWVSWLVDSLPGCSGGGVLNGNDELVGLNGGYLDGRTRLAVIIPVRAEMFRNVPADLHREP